MGRFGSPQLGYHAEEDDHDIPELNKCPSCGAFFEGDICPICKTVCPEEMKAGNRVTPKKKKRKPKRVGYRVPPVWYLRTWFILLMLMVSRFIGLILVWMSDWKKWVKVTVTIVALFGSYILGFVIMPLADRLLNPPVEYVNLNITETEYRDRCREISYEALMREPTAYADHYLMLTLTVKDVKYVGKDVGYYDASFEGDVILASDENGKEFLLYDCRESGKSILEGDAITVFGEFGGVGTQSAMNQHEKYPIVYIAYADLLI